MATCIMFSLYLPNKNNKKQMKTLMKFSAILTCVFVICANVKAEQECYTPSPPPPAWLFTPSLRSTITESSYILRVYFHIVRSSSGNGLSSGIVNTMLSKLNTEFASTGIQFQSIGYDFIDNNTYYDNLSDGKFHCYALLTLTAMQ